MGTEKRNERGNGDMGDARGKRMTIEYDCPETGLPASSEFLDRDVSEGMSGSDGTPLLVWVERCPACGEDHDITMPSW